MSFTKLVTTGIAHFDCAHYKTLIRNRVSDPRVFDRYNSGNLIAICASWADDTPLSENEVYISMSTATKHKYQVRYRVWFHINLTSWHITYVDENLYGTSITVYWYAEKSETTLLIYWLQFSTTKTCLSFELKTRYLLFSNTFYSSHK